MKKRLTVQGGVTHAVLGVALAPDGQTAWVTVSNGRLGKVSNADKPDSAKLELIPTFPEDTIPREIAIDKAGYLWVSLQNLHQVAKVTPNGNVLQRYDTGPGSEPSGIIWAGPIADQLWISDEAKDHRQVLAMSPRDAIDPVTGKSTVSLNALPNEGTVKPGETFAWTITADASGGSPVETWVELGVPQDAHAHFGSIVKVKTMPVPTGPDGTFSVTAPIVEVTANDGDVIQVSAAIRGLTVPALFTGHVSSIEVDAFTTYRDVPDAAYVGHAFPNPVAVKLTGKNVANRAKVTFRITGGEAIFSINSQKQITVTVDQNGEAELHLKAGSKTGPVWITAESIDDGLKRTVEFKRRTVVAIPNKIRPEGDVFIKPNISAVGGVFRIGFGTSDIIDEPTPFAVVSVAIDETAVQKGIKFVDKDEKELSPNNAAKLQADENGRIQLNSPDSNAYLLAPISTTGRTFQ